MLPPIPPLFLERMQALLTEEYPAFRQSLDQPPTAGLRVNTLKASPAAFAAQPGLLPVAWCPEGFMLDKTAQERFSGRSPLHAAGAYYLQDPAAMAAISALEPQPGERILDISAAPGGKATHIAARLGGQGLLVANEIHPQRAWDLAENLERFGVTNAAVLQETPERLVEHFGAYFDRVLLDAPCSGEGMFRKSGAARQQWSPALVQGCAARQSILLEQAARLVRPGGWLLYSTCTFAPEEDEQALAAFLHKCAQGKIQAHFELASISAYAQFAPGRPAWAGPDAPDSLALAARIWPHLPAAGDGHFIALLRRTDDGPDTELPPPAAAKISAEARRVFNHFCQETLSAAAQSALEAARLAQVGSYLYALPASLPDLGRLRALHPGLWLGEYRKERFEPAHALALAALPSPRQALFAEDDPALLRYRRGETLPAAPGASGGWLAVSLSSALGQYPLGWARCANGILKNHYPKGLRSMG